VKDYRTIPVEVLRDFARAQTETTSIRDVSDQIGVSHSALHKFVTGRTDPQPRTRRRIALWYLERIDTAHDLDVARPYAGALNTLLAGLPEAQRSGTETRVLADVAEGYADAGMPPPRWVELLTKWGKAVRS
jgi:hypothetical protein